MFIRNTDNINRPTRGKTYKQSRAKRNRKCMWR